ncbi:hypothetical protein V8E51_000439 [Hyaloscypha variabilis]
MLAKYTTLGRDGSSRLGKRVWQHLWFGSKTQELGVVRGKLITYTSTMSILIDMMQSQALDRVETKIDDGFGEVRGEFERMRKEILSMATQARASDKNGSSLSLLSLSTYPGDEKEVWKAFRRELIQKGFRSRSLDKYGHVLQAYMLKLEESGLLDNARTQRTTSDELQVKAHYGGNAEKLGTAVERSLPPVIVLTPDPSSTDKEAKASYADNNGPQELPRDKSTNPQDVRSPSNASPTRRKVAFASVSANCRDSDGKMKAVQSTKSILRRPTRQFPEDPDYLREGVGLREEAIGNKVPQDARITKLDKSKVDIVAMRRLIPRCEERGDHVLVFKFLEDADIAFFTELTDLMRDYPHFEMGLLLLFFGAFWNNLKPFIMYDEKVYNEYYPDHPLPDHPLSVVELARTFSEKTRAQLKQTYE